MKDSELVHIMNAARAQELRAALERFRQTQDMASRLWLKNKFTSFKYAATDICVHVMKLEQLMFQMRSADCGSS